MCQLPMMQWALTHLAITEAAVDLVTICTVLFLWRRTHFVSGELGVHRSGWSFWMLLTYVLTLFTEAEMHLLTVVFQRVLT